ncbi:MAG: histidine kinase [Lachnospiraceae bacterium]|nr:histidine kinase [Lachnospiraceae bacterium]
MRFQTKIIVGYTVFVFVLALLLGFGFYYISVNQSEEQAKTNLGIAASSIATQMDEKLLQMETTMNYILSDPKMLEGIQLLGKAGDGNISDAYVADARAAIQAGISTDYIINHSYRTVVFNRTGEIAATYSTLSRRTVDTVDFESMPYLTLADDSKGQPILIGTHSDIWGVQENPQVFSLKKAVQGYNTGYIEVENLVTDLEEMQVSQDDLVYMIIVDGDELLYSSDEKVALTDYTDVLGTQGETILRSGNQRELVSCYLSDRYPITVLAIQDMAIVAESSAFNLLFTMLIVAVFFILSMIFVVFLSHMLTKPIRQLRMVMENTKLENLGEDVDVYAPNDEIKALSNSYQNVMGRLQKSMVKEKRLSILQLQAQFDSLQAQVNPHFMYNVLNIIAARGMSNGDDSICEMCGSLAAMLRYSTNNKNRYASIREELEYLDQYFYLLKARYEHRIDFAVTVEEEVLNQLIPKVALQQIVENCINHGFENSGGQMRITITGWCEDKKWYIKIHDNGQGFSGEAMGDLQKSMKHTRSKLLDNLDNMEMEIGGMGLINTYARCLLLYSDSLIFTMNNVEDGADVIVGASLDEPKE